MRIFAWVMLATLMSASASASTFFEKEILCPVGGERFEVIDYGSYSTWGAFPDGMPVGSAGFPIELHQCPSNGLVLFDEFNASEARRLAPLVASAEYQRLRRSETRYYLAYWLGKRLGDTENTPWLLLSATWEAKNADQRSERAQRYAREFVELMSSRPVDDHSLESIALRGRAANALRELGRFDEAEKLRASITVANAAKGEEEEEEEDAAENREGWRSFLPHSPNRSRGKMRAGPRLTWPAQTRRPCAV